MSREPGFTQECQSFVGSLVADTGVFLLLTVLGGYAFHLLAALAIACFDEQPIAKETHACPYCSVKVRHEPDALMAVCPRCRRVIDFAALPPLDLRHCADNSHAQ